MQLGKLVSHDVVTISPEATVREAARLMRTEHVGSLVVIARDHRPIGILTDRDIVISVVAESAERIDTIAVKDILSPDPIVALETEDLESALSRMSRHGIRRLPVISAEGTLVGVLALDDCLKALATQLMTVADLLRAEQRREERQRS